ncbi:MAG TPA: DNA integrity scanning protein DisA nucleotide-binding domain protein [Candidatus Binatia bacterium]
MERHITGGIVLDGKLSILLLRSIYQPHSPGHDGAVLIDKDRILRFAAHLPLSKDLSQMLIIALLDVLSGPTPITAVVSIAAVKIDATDLMFGNLLGSNLFNMAILAVDDLLYLKGPILAHASPAHVGTANAAMAITAIAVIGLTYRVSKKRLLFAWDSWAILAVYVFAVSVVYVMR